MREVQDLNRITDELASNKQKFISDEEDYDYEPRIRAEDTKPLRPEFTQPITQTHIYYDVEDPTVSEILKAIEASYKNRIPFSQFMDISLYAPQSGYYSTGKVEIGRGADSKDFKTSPEESTIFGGAYAFTMYSVWLSMGLPDEFEVVEMGAGQGSLAEGFMIWAEKISDRFYRALKYQIVEYSQSLITRQKSRLQPFGDKINWRDGSAYETDHGSIKGGFIFNELYDAFPIERVQRLNGEVVQKYITVKDGQWVEIWDEPSQEVLDYIEEVRTLGYELDIREGAEEPINIPALSLQRQLHSKLESGAIINTDYGVDGRVGWRNFSCIRFYGKETERRVISATVGEDKWGYVSPGSVDITASVDFQPLILQAEHDGLLTAFNGLQKDFILTSGIVAEVSKLFTRIDNHQASWKEYLEIMELIEGYKKIMTRGLGEFHTIVLVKNLPMPKKYHPTLDELQNRTVTGKPIILGVPNQELIIEYEGNRQVYTTNSEGELWYPISSLDQVSATVMLDGTEYRFDFKEDEELRDKVARGQNILTSLHLEERHNI